MTGNLAAVSAVLVRGGPLNPAQAPAVPVFILAVAAIWPLAGTSSRHGLLLVTNLIVVRLFYMI
jgi:hypothetical protein